MAPNNSESDDIQLRILKTIQNEEINKKWEGEGFVYAHAAKWKRNTISDVMILQELEMVREENKAIKDQVSDLKREQGELTDLIRQMSEVILNGNHGGRTTGTGSGEANKGGKHKPQEKNARDWSGEKNSKKPRSDKNPLPGSKQYADAKNGAEEEEKVIKKVKTVMNEDGTDLDKIPYTVPKGRYRPQKIPEPERIRLKEKNEEETNREVIFCGIPSPPQNKYVKESPFETAKLILKACDELKTQYLGNHYGINVKHTDLAFAQRQIGHVNKRCTPITVRFRKKEVAEKVLAAAKFLNILNKRGVAQFGLYREPKEYTNERNEVVKPHADVIKRFENRPETFMKKSRTLEQQQSDRAARDYRASKEYQARQRVKEFIKEQRISQAHLEAAAAQLPEDEDPNKAHDEEQYGKIPEPPEENTDASFETADGDEMTPQERKDADAAEKLRRETEEKKKKEAGKSQPNKSE